MITRDALLTEAVEDVLHHSANVVATRERNKAAERVTELGTREALLDYRDKEARRIAVREARCGRR